jgi:colicin import membrane protein
VKKKSQPPKPDVAKPDVAKPDVAKPDVAKPDVAKPDAPKPDAPPAESVLEPAGELVVEVHPVPPKGPVGKQIHSRKPLPRVPDSPRDSAE